MLEKYEKEQQETSIQFSCVVCLIEKGYAVYHTKMLWSPSEISIESDDDINTK